MDPLIHLKIKNHNDSDRHIVVKVKLHGAHRIQEAILKNPFSTCIIYEGRDGEVDRVSNVVNLDVRKGEPPQTDELVT